MNKYLAMATAAAIAAAAIFSYAQTPPSTDRPSGLPGDATSGQPNPEKKGGAKGTTAAPKADTNTPPSTDRPSGQPGDATSGKPNPDKKSSPPGKSSRPVAGLLFSGSRLIQVVAAR